MDNNKNCLNCKYNVNKENKNYCLIGSGFYNGTDEMCAETSCEKWEDAGMTGTMSLTMAIKALEQQPSEDVLDNIKAEIIEKFDNCSICEWFEDYDYDENDISEYIFVGHISDIIDIIDKYIK